MKKVFHSIFGGVALLCLLVCCKNVEPALYSIELHVSGNGGTATIDKSSVPVGSIVTLQCIPDIGFESSIYLYSESYISRYFNDSEDKNKYYVLVEGGDTRIDVDFIEKKKVQISTYERYHSNSNIPGSVTVTPEYAREGQTVDIYFSPDQGYKLTDFKIKSYGYSDDIEYSIDPNDKNHYFFIMEEGFDKVTIYYSFVPELEISAEKDAFPLNEPIILNVTGASENKLYDIYVGYIGIGKQHELIGEGIDLSGGTLELPDLGVGEYYLYTRDCGKTIDLFEFKVVPEDLMAGWTVSNLMFVEATYDFNGRKGIYFDVGCGLDKLRYYFESNPDDIKEMSFQSITYTWFYIDYIYEKPADAIVFQAYDFDRQIITNKVRYEIPVAPETPSVVETKIIPFSELGFSSFFDFINSKVIVTEEDSKYFDYVKNEVTGTLEITPKKTTDITRVITLKNSEDEICSTVSFKILYSYKSPDYEITR